MTDEENAETAGTDDGQPTAGVQKSAAAAAARRARRIGGQVRATAPAKPADPVTLAKPPAAAPAEPVTGPAAATDVAPADEAAATLRVPAAEPTDVVPADSPTADPGSTGARSALRWLPAGVLVAAAVTMAVLLATFSHSVWWAKPSAAVVHHARNQIREQVLAAAKQCVVTTNTYGYKTFDQDLAKGLKCTTGAQSTHYKAAMENLIRGPAIKLKASQVPQINTAGIEAVTAGGKQWSILVFGQVAVHTANVKSRTDPFAAVVQMDDVHGKWLISGLQLLHDPSG